MAIDNLVLVMNLVQDKDAANELIEKELLGYQAHEGASVLEDTTRES